MDEINRLHEVYDVENVMKMINVLNDENDLMYDKLMMIKLSYKQLAEKHNNLVKKYNKIQHQNTELKRIVGELLALDDL